jgi:hypothetical protein
MKYILHPYMQPKTHTLPDLRSIRLLTFADNTTIRTKFEIKTADNEAAAVAAEQLTPITAP